MTGPEQGTVASGFILTIVQTVKSILPEKWYSWSLPLLALLLGVTYRVWVHPDGELSTGLQILEGVRDGAAAIGIFSIGKKAKETVTKKPTVPPPPVPPGT